MIFHSLTSQVPEGNVENTSRGTFRILMNVKIMFDHYYCANSMQKPKKMLENFITLITFSYS